MTSLDLYWDAALSRVDSRRVGRSLARLDGQTAFGLARIDQVDRPGSGQDRQHPPAAAVLTAGLVLLGLGTVVASGLAAWWRLGPPSPAERRYRAHVERRAAERQIEG